MAEIIAEILTMPMVGIIIILFFRIWGCFLGFYLFSFAALLIVPLLLVGWPWLLVYKLTKDAREKYKNSDYYQTTGRRRSDLSHYDGSRLEYMVYKKLEFLQNRGVRFVMNAYIPNEFGETTELDCVVIAPQGIFVLECKDYSGWIFGSEHDKKWTEVFPNGDKVRFGNPINQNQYHIKCLAKILRDVPMHSIVVFSNACTFKSLNISNTCKTIVCYFGELQNIALNKMGSMVNPKLTKEEIDVIYEKLKPYTNVSEETKQQHIESVARRREIEET